MKKSFLLLVFATAFSSAQNKRFTYEYKSIADSTNKVDFQKELLILDVNTAGSLFYSLEKFKSDSIQAVEIEKQSNSGLNIINLKSAYKGKIFYTVEKNYPGFETFLHTKIGNDRYKVVDVRKPIWKITSEKMKIGEFETQKAETDLFGRKWKAWFAIEIPIQDGPYKFSGLPGLIVKIEDQSQSYSFELKGISSYAENNKLKTEAEGLFNKELPIDHLKFKKLFTEQLNDPTKSLRELMNQTEANFKMFDKDGNELKPEEILRQRELKAKVARKKNNNPLELDLLR